MTERGLTDRDVTAALPTDCGHGPNAPGRATAQGLPYDVCCEPARFLL